MEQLTADGGSLPEALADTEAELDRALARAVRLLISGHMSLIAGPAARDSEPVA